MLITGINELVTCDDTLEGAVDEPGDRLGLQAE